MTELSLPRHATSPIRMTTLQYGWSFLRNGRIGFEIALAALATVLCLAVFGLSWSIVLVLVITFVVLALVEYLVHRFLFHSTLFYRHRLTARLWRHLHYSHHMDPTDPRQLVGPPQGAIPLVLAVTVPLGWGLAGPAGAAAAVATGLWLLVLYEYAHGFVHQVAEPASAYGRMLRRHHMLHHFHNETGNFGVTSPVFDILLGTRYESAKQVARCATARNLGYTAAERARYPWAGEGDPPG
jgi:sterol desaturase/sphingolipid hydroxylase (fatty acid hydroxylase superfamily)